MRFAPSNGLLELSAVPIPGMGDDFGRVVAGAGGPSFFIGVYAPVAKVEVQAHQVDAPPPLDTNDVEEVVEFSCMGPAVLYDPYRTSTPELAVIDSDGPHRVRLSCAAAGRRHESWQFWTWPAEPTQAEVLVDPDPDAVADISYLDLPEAAAGLAAAGRIGRDVDRAPGCRTFSGQTGMATSSRVCPGTASRYRGGFYGPHTWTRTRGGVAWNAAISGYPGWYPEDPDHPDQLVGRTGMLVTRPVTDTSVEDSKLRSKPPIVVQVNWHVSDTDERACLDPMKGRPLLPEWTHQRTSFARAKTPDGASATSITVEHSGLPVEWIADMTDWWTFQLAIHEQYVEQFRR